HRRGGKDQEADERHGTDEHTCNQPNVQAPSGAPRRDLRSNPEWSQRLVECMSVLCAASRLHNVTSQLRSKLLNFRSIQVPSPSTLDFSRLRNVSETFRRAPG